MEREIDPRLQPYVNGAVALRRDGETLGYIASTVGWFWSPSRPFRRQPWLWFLVVWADGARELPFEDYPSQWVTLSRIEQGTFVWDQGPHEGEYAVEVLAPEQASAVWEELGISVEDF